MEKQRITYEVVVQRLAPCGIDCHRCVRYDEGEIAALARRLKTALGGFETMAARVADRNPALREYPAFAAILDFLGEGGCPGCREGGAPLPFCAARTCFREKGVDFCFQCDEYPCDRNEYPENVAARWRAANDRMRDEGPEDYYRESLEKPRY
jgi:hypothetical protein